MKQWPFEKIAPREAQLHRTKCKQTNTQGQRRGRLKTHGQQGRECGKTIPTGPRGHTPEVFTEEINSNQFTGRTAFGRGLATSRNEAGFRWRDTPLPTEFFRICAADIVFFVKDFRPVMCGVLDPVVLALSTMRGEPRLEGRLLALAFGGS
jgi:hypothetical protein